MNQPKTSKAEATPRPWIAKLGPFDHDNDGARPIMSTENADGERHRIAMVDSVAPRKRSTPYDAPDAERDANVTLIVQAVNEYAALCAVVDALSGHGTKCAITVCPLCKALSALAALRAKEGK